jgi:hypothetical protein
MLDRGLQHAAGHEHPTKVAQERAPLRDVLQHQGGDHDVVRRRRQVERLLEVGQHDRVGGVVSSNAAAYSSAWS